MNIVISIIIPTYKRYQSLKSTLESVIQNSVSQSEIIIVDQSPNNNQNAIKIKKKHPFIKYICYNTPNLPKARNIGIINSRGSIICFIDDDVIVHPSCIKEHISLHAKNDIYAIAGRIKQKNKNYPWEQISIVTTIDTQTGETKGNFDIDYNGNVLYATGGHMSIKRTVFEKVGLFNSRFIGNALYEDVEFSCRMRKKGFTITYNPNAIIYHYPLDRGGCHESKGFSYLLERLHNQSLFYLLHIQLIPSLTFLKYCKNLIEFISRNKNKTYSFMRLTLSIIVLIKAYLNAVLSLLFIPKLKRK